MPRYLGLDLHLRYVHVCEWLPEEQRERHSRFPATAAGWDRFLRTIGPDCWVALEVTGNAFEVYDRLLPHAGEVLLANPVALRRLGSGRHTDRVDAARLAKMLAMGTLPTVWVPPQPIRELRRLTRYRERLLAQTTRYRNQIRAVLRRYEYYLPRGINPSLHLEPLLLEQMSPADRVIVLSALHQLQCTQQECAALDAEITERLAGIPEAQALLSITGVGPITAAVIGAALGDAARFRDPKQVARYAGLDPSVHQSGEAYFHGHISKNGNTLLRKYLVEAANVLARFDKGPLGDFYRHKRCQIGHKRAVVALARKLLIVAWRIMLTGEPYRYTRPKAVRNKRWQLNALRRNRRDWEAMLCMLFAPDEEKPVLERNRTRIPA